MAAGEPWMARIEGVLEAHFFQPDGGSRPGADYAVGLRRGAEERRITVRAYLADGVRGATRRDTRYQAQTVLDYVFDRIAAGWSPEAGEPLPPVTILDPKPGDAPPDPPPERRGGWFRRLFGG